MTFGELLINKFNLENYGIININKVRHNWIKILRANLLHGIVRHVEPDMTSAGIKEVIKHLVKLKKYVV